MTTQKTFSRCRYRIDFSVLPTEWIDLFRTGASLELEWLTTLAARTRKFKAKIPSRGL